MLGAVFNPIVEALGAVAAAALLVDDDGRHLQMAGQLGYVPGLPAFWQDTPLDAQVPAADVLRTREALYFEDAGALIAIYPDLEAQTGAVAAIATAVLPMFLDGRPLGSLVLDFNKPHSFPPEERYFLRTVAAQCAIALERAASLQLLDRHLAEHTRKTLENARAQEAFMAFTEAVGSEIDLPSLVRQAIIVLQNRFPGASIGYFEEKDGLWKARVWSANMHPELVAVVSAGVPADTPLIAQAIQTRQPVFTDAWDAVQEGVAVSAESGATASYPLLVNGELHWLLSVGLRDICRWSEADRALVRAVCRGLNLALERSETARQLTLQNAELLARTHALEAFADLTRDLALTTDPLLLIKRAQEVVLTMLSGGTAMYMVPEGDRWYCRVQHGTLHSPELQAVVDAGLPGTPNLLTPWTTGQPYFQDAHDRANAQLSSLVAHVSASVTLPLRVEGTLAGVLAFVLFEQRTWSSVDHVVLETALQSLELALDLAAKTRRLEEERAALEAFTRFARAVGSETEVQPLVRHALTLLEDIRSSNVSYSERDGDLFKIRIWNPGFPVELLARSLEGYSLDQPSFARANLERQAIFEEHWDAEQQGVPASAMYRAGAFQPFFEDGEMTGMLIMGSRTLSHWSERDRGIFQAVGQSLALALDRARQTRTVTAQRDALEAQTQNLAARTRELETSAQELQAFSYSVSHDLRTPVRHMIGFLQLARTSLDGKLDERSARYLDVVEQAGGQMNTLIDAMLNLSRVSQQPLQWSAVDLNEVMAQIQTTLLPDLLTRTLRWEVAPMPRVWGDRDAVTLVLTQLAENALKFTRTRDPAVIRVSAEDQGDVWRVSVQDNGLGFDPRYQDRLFTMFQRLHSVQEAAGTGVGLASIRRLILKHGGQVFAEGQVDQGATFGFTLPKRSPELHPTG